MGKPFLLASTFQQAALGAEGSEDLPVGGPTGKYAGPFIALHAEGSADAQVTFDCAITGNTHTAWTIGANGWWVGPCQDVTVISGRVSGKKVTL